ncbi:MAG: hypothetical protein H8E44_42815 [Planctomycetes bacterium]|nr:hypothetical protein [Planctomycetota bacterium]MBL7037662.1 hypothetical protein [Pirellulaceae bacterium]
MLQKLGFLFFVLRKWVPRYLAACRHPRPRPAHVMFCMVDHFEPGADGVTRDVEKERMGALLSQYPRLVDTHADAYGNWPKRTWFFPPHYHRFGNLKDLVSLCEQGYGEVELHLHHGKSKPDTAENLERTIRLCIEEYSQFGVFGTEQDRKRYAFIHGDWALNNSRKNQQYCGVDNELHVLKKTGCYADFTFPSCNESNPMQINSIYYAQENAGPKAHNRGNPVRANRGPGKGLLIVQGPLHPLFLEGRAFGLRAFGDDIALGKPGSAQRVDLWIKTWIHVQGKRDWVFVKVHTHGVEDAEVVLGADMDESFGYMEDEYNDGGDYVLHYVTARELYNIVKAAEAGEAGDPEQYRDFRVSRPSYDSSPKISEASDELRNAVYETYTD